VGRVKGFALDMANLLRNQGEEAARQQIRIKIKGAPTEDGSTLSDPEVEASVNKWIKDLKLAIRCHLV